ncbi:sulfotransferase domain protein [Geobacter sp. OR-1]|uniref:sulfotransferase family protein n=1 Tax=Geobacter sp. OR-1 TaxID=1266765 RepID=UPI0005437E09|nr:sulfotransferase [Geobacter sp. OR-1]GAM09270.1 sulfotransferase domain protein [Geobacter sp. OR-1]
MNPIFIIGTERSGTNLLRLILNAHSAISVPHPPHIMKFFGPLATLYGDLGDDRNFRRLIADVCRMVELHTYPWEIRPDRDQVFREARDWNLLCIYFAVYDQYLAFTGKERWCCKSTFMIEHVADILHYYPEARFIFMVRDGRDVAVSAKASIFNHFHVYYSARRWQREQRLGLDLLAKLPREQMMLLKYEELVADPATIVQQLCDFLGERFEPQMLDYYRSQEARKSGSLSISWANTAKPVLKNNTEKFRQRLSQQEIFQIEAITFREMLELGYEPTCQLEQLMQKHKEMMQERLAYRLEELTLKLRAELNHLLRDKNSFARIRKNLYIEFIGILRRLTPSHARH